MITVSSAAMRQSRECRYQTGIARLRVTWERSASGS
jgi:hypothetical protein